MTVDLTRFVKTYDVRGLVGTELTDDVVEALAAGFVDEVGAAGRTVVVGHDMRDSSPGFAAAFIRGATARGANVNDNLRHAGCQIRLHPQRASQGPARQHALS
jgi:phosphomannomutase